MGRLPTSRLGIVDWRRLVEDTAVVAERLGPRPRPASARGDAERRPAPDGRDRQGAVARRAPDRARRAVRCPRAMPSCDGLVRVMRRLAEKGVAFIYISHRLNEVFRITDRVTVMKDGRVVATEPHRRPDPRRLVRLMVGRDLGEIYGRAARRRPRATSALDGPRSDAARASSTTSTFDVREPARSSASPGWPARAGPRCCARSTAPTRSTRARSRSSGSRSRSGRRATRSPSASGC